MSEKKQNFWGRFSRNNTAVSQAADSKGRNESVVDNSIHEENLPDAIADHIEHLAVLEDKVAVARKHATSAKTLALEAKNKPSNFFARRKAIEALQMSAFGLANANADMMDAIALSFADQRKIGEILSQLLILCASNLASTRELIAQLEAGLRKVEKGEYSEETKAEITRIIHELKAREDWMARQEKQDAAIREYGAHLQAAEHHLLEHDDRHNETAAEVSQTNQLLAQTRSELKELKQKYTTAEEAHLKSEKQNRFILLGVAIVAVLLIILF